MIKLEIQPYCNNCTAFRPDVQESQEFCKDNETIRGRCEGIRRYLIREGADR